MRDEEMDCVRLDQGHSAYPPTLSHYLGNEAPISIATLGNLDILRQNKLAFFCSVRCPAALILRTHDLARQWRQSRETVIGGFHSPVEKECLGILLHGSQPIIVCPARSLKKMRVRKEWRKPLEEGRLLFLSSFPDNRHRGDTEMALQRNRFVAALADKIFVAYAAPSGKIEQFCCETLGWGKALYTIKSDINSGLVAKGVRPLSGNDRFDCSEG